MSADLTDETLTEWRKEADYVRMSDDDPLLVERDDRILALLDALNAERAAREEAERDLADLRAKVKALADEWNGIALDQHEIRFTVPSDSLRALLGGDQ